MMLSAIIGTDISLSSGLGVGIIVAAFLAGVVVVVAVRLYMDRTRRATLAAELAAIKTAAEAEAQKICAQAEAQAKSEYLKRR